MNYPPQYPGYPPVQQFPQQPVQQFPQQQQYPAPYGGQQGFPPGPPAPPPQPLAQGTLDDYYSQPSSGGGPAISWSANGQPKPLGTSYVGIVARDVTHADVQQQTDPKTGAPKFYRDGRPQFVLKIPLKVQPSQEFPEGEAVLFVRGQMRDELTRAMSEAGAGREPKGGDALQVTLVQRKPSRGGGMPMNVFAIRYQPANPGQQPVPQQQDQVTDAPSPAPVAQPQQQYPAQGQGQQYVPPAAPPAFPPQGQTVSLEQVVGQQPPPPPAPQPAAQEQPQGQVQVAPSDLSPEQQQLLARLSGGAGQ